MSAALPYLRPDTARRIFNRRTGFHVSRAEFYRWLAAGLLRSTRLGRAIYIHWRELHRFQKQCLAGERGEL